MKPRDAAPAGDGRWDGTERRLRPRSAGWGRGAATAFERMRHLETMNPPVQELEPEQHTGRDAGKPDSKA